MKTRETKWNETKRKLSINTIQTMGSLRCRIVVMLESESEYMRNTWMLWLLLVRLLLLLVYSEHSPNARERKQKEKCDDIGKKKTSCVHEWIVFSVYNSPAYLYTFAIFLSVLSAFSNYMAVASGWACERETNQTNEESALYLFARDQHIVSVCSSIPYVWCMWMVWTEILLMFRGKFGAFFSVSVSVCLAGSYTVEILGKQRKALERLAPVWEGGRAKRSGLCESGL